MQFFLHDSANSKNMLMKQQYMQYKAKTKEIRVLDLRRFSI